MSTRQLVSMFAASDIAWAIGEVIDGRNPRRVVGDLEAANYHALPRDAARLMAAYLTRAAREATGNI